MLTGNTSWMPQAEVASAATSKPLTVDQVIGKLTASAKTLKSYHLNSNKKMDIQREIMSFGITNTLDLDILRQPTFAAKGTLELGDMDDLDAKMSFDLYANDKEFYHMLDVNSLFDESEDETNPNNESDESSVDANDWVPMDKTDWDALFTRSQYDPASMLDSVKNYKKLMKVVDAGSQTVLQFTITDPKASKVLIQLYDRDNVADLGTIQPKSVSWKLYINKKTCYTEKLAVNLNYSLVEDGQKDTISTKIEAKYSSHNKVAGVVKPTELE